MKNAIEVIMLVCFIDHDKYKTKVINKTFFKFNLFIFFIIRYIAKISNTKQAISGLADMLQKPIRGPKIIKKQNIKFILGKVFCFKKIKYRMIKDITENIKLFTLTKFAKYSSLKEKMFSNSVTN